MPRSASAPTFVGDGRIEFAERELPDPDPGQLLLDVEANAICGTDREQYFAGLGRASRATRRPARCIAAGRGHGDRRWARAAWCS